MSQDTQPSHSLNITPSSFTSPKKAFLGASSKQPSMTSRSSVSSEKEGNTAHIQSQEPNISTRKKKPRRYIRVNPFCACLCPCLLMIKEIETKQAQVSFVPSSVSRVVAEDLRVKKIPGLLPFQDILNSEEMKRYLPLPRDVSNEPLSVGIYLHERGEIRLSTQLFNHSACEQQPVGLYLFAMALRHGWGVEEDHAHAFELFELATQSILTAMRPMPLLQENLQVPSSSEMASRRGSSAEEQTPGTSDAGNSQGLDARSPTSDSCVKVPRSGNIIHEEPTEAASSSSDKEQHEASQEYSRKMSMKEIDKTHLLALHNIAAAHSSDLSPTRKQRFASTVSLPNLKDTDVIREFLPLPIMEIGMCYLFGWGVKQSKSTGAYFIHIAAQLGDPDAQLQLGHLYLRGTGVRRSKHMASKWLRLAELGGRKEVGQAWIWKEKYDDASAPDKDELSPDVLAEKIDKTFGRDGSVNELRIDGSESTREISKWKQWFSKLKGN